MPSLVDSKMEVQDRFDTVINRLQLFEEWYYSLVKGELLYFPPGINNSDRGPED
jgi:hypothetical protein